MQDTLASPEASVAYPTQRRSLVPALATTLAMLLSLFLGLQVAPWLAELGWEPPRLRAEDPAVRWRKAQFDPERDPALGMPVPSMRLHGAGGRRIPLVSDLGEHTALLFVGSGAG